MARLLLAVLIAVAVPTAGRSLAGATGSESSILGAAERGKGPRREVPPDQTEDGKGAQEGRRPSDTKDDAEKPAPSKAKKSKKAKKQVEVVVPRKRGAVPVGKGMWLYEPDKVEGGNVAALVARARAVGLTHIYVRTGSSRMGFHGGPFLDQVLPAAHEAGLRVYGWDFPYLHDPMADVQRALTAIRYRTPGGHRIDGFVPDIETPSEGTNLSAQTARDYSITLRRLVGSKYPLIACVPRPSEYMMRIYPYAAILSSYDAVAPMVYWLNRQPDSDAAGAVAFFQQFGKPVIPVGQAYDGAPEGGRPGPPPRDEILRFLRAAEAHGAAGASFWSWQHASPEVWDAVRDAGEFRLPNRRPANLRPADVRSVQTLLTSLGYAVEPNARWGKGTTTAVKAYQRDARIPQTGVFDKRTRRLMLQPFAPPVGAPPAPAPAPPAPAPAPAPAKKPAKAAPAPPRPAVVPPLTQLEGLTPQVKRAARLVASVPDLRPLGS